MPHLGRLPDDVRETIRSARQRRGWSQRETGRAAGITQRHLSRIESGSLVPRYDTLLDLVRALDLDIVVVPRALVAPVRALVHDHDHPDAPSALSGPLFAAETDPHAG